MLTELQYALLEPPDGGQSWPSEVWDREEVIDALNSGERDLLRRTHLVVSRVELNVVAGQDPIALPADWLATARGVWANPSGVYTPLAPVDTTEANLGDPDWRDGNTTPVGLSDSDLENLQIRLIPMASENGALELLYIRVPTPVNGNGRSFTVPDEYLSAVKYGALQTLLGKVGRLQDPERAEYCKRRVDVMVAAAEIILGGWA